MVSPTYSRAKVRSLGLIIGERRSATGRPVTWLASHLGMSKSALSRFENGQGWPSNAGDLTEGVTRILAALGVHGDDLDGIMRLVYEAETPNWLAVGGQASKQFAAMLDYEAVASRITSVSTLVLPGLMQTREYAEAVFQSGDVAPDEQRQRTATRLSRQKILDRVQYLLIVDEAVLSKPVGTVSTMVEQLGLIMALTKRHNIDVRVIPDARASLTVSGGYVVLEFSNQPPVAYADHAFGGILLDEVDRVAHHMLRTTKLLSATLSSAESVELIGNIMENLTSKTGE